MVEAKLSREELQRAYDQYHSEHSLRGTSSMAERRFYKGILELFRTSLSGSILDVGCGTGFFLKVARERGLVTFGIDISPSAVDIARSVAPESDIRSGVGEDLPWPDSHFDYVTCLGSLEHFLDPGRACREMARVLKPGGLCLILVPNAYFLGHIYMAYRHGVPPDETGQDFSERFATRSEWQKLLEDNGLEVLRVHRWNPSLWATQKAGTATKLAYSLLRPFIPLNLSAQFAFICGRQHIVADSQ